MRHLLIMCTLCLATFAQNEGTKIWSAGMESGSISEWTQNSGGNQENSNGGTSTAVLLHPHSGSWSDQLTINDPSGSSSAGTRMFRWLEPRNNRDAYYDFWYYIPQYYTIVGGNHFWQAFQFKSRTNPSDPSYPTQRIDPLWSFYFDDPGGNTYRVMLGWGFGNTVIAGPRQGDTVSGKDIRQGTAGWCDSGGCTVGVNVPVGQYVHFILFLHESSGNCSTNSKASNYDGHITLWQDGAKIFDVNDVATSYNYGTTYNSWCAENEWSVSLYSSGLTPAPSSVYVDDAAIFLPGSGPPTPPLPPINLTATPH